MRNKSYSYIELELQKLGLNENEAKTYLAALELGQTSVQKLAEKLKASRPTVYRTLETLQRKELLEKIDRKKGSAVKAKSPDELLGLLRVQKREVEEREREFVRIISLLKTEHSHSNKNTIEIFAGVEGKKFLLDDFSTTHSKKIFVLFNPDAGVSSKELTSAYENISSRLGGIEVVEFHGGFPKASPLAYVERKTINQIPDCTLILGKKIAIFYSDQMLCISDEKIVSLLKFFFHLL